MNYENTSTPRRKRLGTGRIYNPSKVLRKGFSPVHTRLVKKIESKERCESPSIPCNQVEYLSDLSNSSLKSDLPPSPGFVDCSFVLNDNVKDDFIEQHELSNTAKQIQEEIEDISDDMFHSKLEFQQSGVSYQDENVLNHDKHYRQDVEKSFQKANESICGLEVNNISEINELFTTKDSFLIDLKDPCDVAINHNNEIQQNNGMKHFYGLPLTTKGLFKTYRNIEKFYDWQEECLNLNAIKNRKNLIYALPTSGGKTLVAEVLMLKEVLVRKKNVLFILPFVAIVQEKIWALSPFAVQLEFLVEEYAAGKGHLPPKKRRKKNSIYVATIEKGLAVIRSLIELNRLNEIGLIVVDELHLIGEEGRGGTLETLLTTVIFANKGIQIVGMSATIGNLAEIAQFLHADVFERHFRPVELTEYVKLGDTLYRMIPGDEGLDFVPHRKLAFEYSAAARALDPDFLGGLVWEVAPKGSCLVFCPTKKNCENVAALLCKMQRREIMEHRKDERRALAEALKEEGASADLVFAAKHGVGYHHAGLASDERSLLENAFRSGVVWVICCTSTLAAGVNLPAQRVVVRAPRVALAPIPLSAYRQMVGRAGRAGHCEAGESIIICSQQEWPVLRATLRGGLAPVRSRLASQAASTALALSALALGLASCREQLRNVFATTLLAVQTQRMEVDMKSICDDAIRFLIHNGAIEVAKKTLKQPEQSDASHIVASEKYTIYNDTELVVSKLGNAAIKGCLELGVARQLLQDVLHASRGLVLAGSLHLLYLVTPHDAPPQRDYRHYYTLYTNLNEECLQTANALGITEKCAIRMITGKPITSVPEMVLSRFYMALMLYDLWNQVPLPVVVDKYMVSRGVATAALTTAAALAASAARVCEVLGDWPWAALLGELAPRLACAAAPDLAALQDLPAVKKARALQLYKAGFKRIEDIAKTTPEKLTGSIDHLSRTAAVHLISAARMMLIEKVENLRAEAEDVMEELNM